MDIVCKNLNIKMSKHLPILSDHIKQIGQSLVNCGISCADIKNHVAVPGCRIPPRCLYLDKDRDQNSPGVVVVGINPGIMLRREQRYIDSCFKNEQISYHDVEAAWRKYGKHRRYYRYGEEVINHINCLSNKTWIGPILWTELVKCQNGDGIKAYHKISRSTFRNCTSRYLKNELAKIPRKFLMLGIGRFAYEALSFLCPEHSLLGIPHLTGARRTNHLQGILTALDEQKGRIEKFATYCRNIEEDTDHLAAAPAYWLRT